MRFGKCCAFALLLLIVECPLFAQNSRLLLLGMGGPTATGGTPIVIDSGVGCSNAAASAATVSCTLTSVTAGDLIVCGGNVPDTTALGEISDSTNGIYSIVAGYDAVGVSWNVIGYFPNAASGTYSVTLTSVAANGVILACQAYKNARTTLVADTGFNLFSDNLGTPSANPTAGTATTPTGTGDLIFGTLFTATNTPTAGSGYSLVSTIPANLFFPEYEIQTSATATNCPYTLTADNWVDTCVALLPSSASAGATPLNGPLLDFTGNTSGATVTTANLLTGFHGFAYGFTNATGTSLTTMVYTNTPSINRHTSVFINGQSFAGNTGLMVDRNVLNADKFLMTMSGQNPSASLGFFFETTQSGLTSGDLCDAAEIEGSGDNVAIGVHADGTGPYLALERTPSTTFSTPIIRISFSTMYWVTWQANSGGTHQLAVYETSGWTQIGTSTVSGLDVGNFTGVSFGNEGSCTSVAGHNYYGNITVDETGSVWPLLP